MNDEISISDHNPAWADMYSEESGRIWNALRPRVRDIQHVGSTAVPGMAAKPIIDILVATDDIVSERDAIIGELVQLGYVNEPHEDDSERLFFRKGSPRTHHLHVVRFRSWAYWEHIMFRDFLIDHPLSAEEYECLKYVLAERHRTDREGYVNGKGPFVEGVLWRAVKERVIVPG